MTEGGAPPQRRVVLVLDDEEAIRTLLWEVLAGLGYEGVGVPSVAEAVAVARARAAGGPAQALAGAIVDLDLGLGESGLDAVRLLRQVEPGLPIILVSGYDLDEVDRSAAAGLPFLRKPYRLGDLERTLAELIR